MTLRGRFIGFEAPTQEPSYTEIDAMAAGYPPDPLLSVDELGGPDFPDRREAIAAVQTRWAELQPWERVARVIEHVIARPDQPPSNLRIAARLVGAATLQEAERMGRAPIAAWPGPGSESDPSQRRFDSPHFRDSHYITALYEYTFDPLTGQLKSRLLTPGQRRATLMEAAAQGGIIKEAYDPNRPFRQERPGKVMLVDFGYAHPGGRKFSKELGWGWPFYGSVDAAPLFIADTADFVMEEDSQFLETPYVARDNREHLIAEFFDLAVGGLMAELQASKSGFLEFKNLAPWGGMLNQGWADSAGAYVHANGEWANHQDGIAAVEVIGYTYDALMKAAHIYQTKFQEPGKAEILRARARRLQRDFLDKFPHTDEHGTYVVMGEDYDDDGNERQLRVRHVNMGLLLETGILDGNDPEIVRVREAIIDTLFSEGMVTRYGLRTLSKYEAAYRPGGDHVGSIWPHVNEAVARGLIRHGYYGLAYYLHKANWLIYMESHATPEYIRGDSTTRVLDNLQEIVAYNTRYQRMYMLEIAGQRYQGWANEAILAAKHNYYPPRLVNDRSRARIRLPTTATEPMKRRREQAILLTLPSQPMPPQAEAA